MSAPILTTERLTLRPFRMQDAPVVEQLAGDRAIADTTLNVPHPYTREMAEEWIRGHADEIDRGVAIILAMETRADGELVGSIALKGIDSAHRAAELGYWVGTPYWGRGFATEAARALIRYGFDALSLNRIYAHHMTRNPASGRVLEKIGMRHEGTLRQDMMKWGRFEDVELYAILSSD